MAVRQCGTERSHNVNSSEKALQASSCSSQWQSDSVVLKVWYSTEMSIANFSQTAIGVGTGCRGSAWMVALFSCWRWVEHDLMADSTYDPFQATSASTSVFVSSIQSLGVWYCMSYLIEPWLQGSWYDHIMRATNDVIIMYSSPLRK